MDLDHSRIELAICYKMANLFDRSWVEACCSKKSIPLLQAEKIDDFQGKMHHANKSLIICDLSNTSIDELQLLLNVSKEVDAKILGFYPHISKQIGIEAKKAGVDYVTPRSGFRAKLDSILS